MMNNNNEDDECDEAYWLWRLLGEVKPLHLLKCARILFMYIYDTDEKTTAQTLPVLSYAV